MISRITLVLVLIANMALAQQSTILLIADDVSPDYFGFYSNSDTAITPTLSNLARNGLIFNRAWAYPICSPTRSSMLTGRYGFRTGMGTVVAGPSTNQLSLNETSLATLLRTQTSPQYATACVGKWHLHSKQGNLNNPSLMGYQYYAGNFAGGIPDYYDYERIVNGTIDSSLTYATTKTIDDAISWLDTIPNGQPFFLWVAFNAPHTPFHKPPNSLITNTSLPGTTNHINQNQEEYFKAAIEGLDTETGRLIQYLSANGLLDSTNFIFIGDNGSPGQVSKNPINNRSKGTIYNYGVEIPMFISGPAVVAPNRRSNELVSTVDIFATVADLSGITNWNPNNVTLDARTLRPAIKNQTHAHRGYQFSEQFGTSGTRDGKSIRNNDYHLIRFDSTQNQEFYKISNDTFETTNLLQNTSTMTSTDVANYHQLCDSLSALIGGVSCLPLLTSQQNLEDKTIQIYPNPVYEQLNIAGETIINNIEIYDSQGRLINKHKGEDLKKVSTKGLSPGYYFLKINTKIIKPFTKF